VVTLRVAWVGERQNQRDQVDTWWDCWFGHGGGGTVERTALVLRVALVIVLMERNKVETAAACLVGVR
jgi:hypothetical protein